MFGPMPHRPRSPAWMALLCLSPAHAWATTVGPVTEVGAPVGAGQRFPALSWQSSATPADNFYIVVWEDNRNEATSGIDLYGARLNRDLVPIDAADATGFNLLEPSVRDDGQTQPSIVFLEGAVPESHLLTWTDPRNALSDIYSATILSSSMTLSPSGGSNVSETINDTESGSSAAFVNGVATVSYQVNIAGGTSAVRARKLNSLFQPTPSLTSFLVESAGFSPSTVGIASQFVTVYQNALARGRTARFPDVTTDNTVTNTNASPTNSGQLNLQVTQLGSDVIAVWQDNRNGSDRDIYAVVLDPATLLPRATEFPLAAEPNDQLTPKVSGNSAGALAVWQDRRNTSSVAQIFGARLGSNGTLLDEDGFVLFTFASNAFEPAVVKGPADDYLVAAVRTGTPNRLFYRVVRDEDPAGTMSGSGRLQVSANGTETATVGFATAAGASGLKVVDGTLYTVTLTPANGAVFSDVDAAPSLAGHQATANDGLVSVNLVSTTVGTVMVEVDSVEGTSNGSVQVEFLNVLPVASNAVLSPLEPRSVEDLVLNYDFFDINGDPDQGTEVRWLRGQELVPTVADRTTVPASETTRGEQWRAQIFASDGRGVVNPAFIESNTVEIGNTPPSAEDPLLTRAVDPTLPVRTGDGLEVRYRFEDVDTNDMEGQSLVEWVDRGEVIFNDGRRTLGGDDVEKGQAWTVRITPSDGIEFGPTVQTATLSVVNTAPIASAGENGEVIERRIYTLDGTGSSDIDPNDQLIYTWSQPVGPAVELVDPTSATPSFQAPSVGSITNLQFDLVVSDGEESSPPDRVAIDVTAVPDADGDGLDDEEEANAGTNPNLADSDRDNLNDADEVELQLNPLDKDTDDDGVRDGDEGRACRTGCDPDPGRDSDADGLIDALQPDSDGDGVLDGTELGLSTGQASGEEDGFAFGGTDLGAGNFVADEDGSETTDPTDEDTDDDTLLDGQEDANRNGRVDDGESDPNDPKDPPTACTTSADCPPDLVCEMGVCDEASGNNNCAPLPDAVECCIGGCGEGGTLTQPICLSGTTREQCPFDANQCAAGACSAPIPSAGSSSGCVCADGDSTPLGLRAFWLLLGFGLVFFSRRSQES